MTWTLMRYTADVLRRDKELLVFTVLSTVLCIGLFAGMFWGDVAGHGRYAGSDTWAYRGRLFLFLFWCYFVITFFNAAIAGCAVMRLRGSNPTLVDGFNMAMTRLPWIVGWALISATVVILMRAVEEKLKGGRWLRLGLEVSWALASFLVVPIMVVEGQDPFRALKTSASLIRRTWGQQVVAGFSFGIIQLLLMLPAVLMAALLPSRRYVPSTNLVHIGLLACYVVLVFLVVTTLEAIFRAALYCHVRGIETPGEMLPAVAAAAMIPESA